MPTRLTHEYVSGCFSEQRCELLDQYTTSCKVMTYRCSCGSLSKINWNNFLKGKRCQECLRNKRSGSRNYQWRSDREDKHLEYRWRQLAYRVLKQVGREPRCSVLLCEADFGYTVEEFKRHIKSQPGYAVNGDWVIDHNYPVWAFVEAGIFDPKLINAFDNLKVIAKSQNSEKCYKFNPVAFVRWLESKGAVSAN